MSLPPFQNFYWALVRLARGRSEIRGQCNGITSEKYRKEVPLLKF